MIFRMFVPTQSEIEILRQIKKCSMNENALILQSDSPELTKKAIEGCLAKGFARRNNEKISITDEGMCQL